MHVICMSFGQWRTNASRQVAWAMKFCTVVPNICESLVWNLLHVAVLVLRILRCCSVFGKFMYPFIWLIQVSGKFLLISARRVLHSAGTGKVSCLEHFRWHTRTLPRTPNPHHLRTFGVVLYIHAP